VFFKALKQNLKIKTFVGVTPNTLKTQVWTAVPRPLRVSRIYTSQCVSLLLKWNINIVSFTLKTCKILQIICFRIVFNQFVQPLPVFVKL